MPLHPLESVPCRVTGTRSCSPLHQSQVHMYMLCNWCPGAADLLYVPGNRRGRTASSLSAWCCFRSSFLTSLIKLSAIKVVQSFLYIFLNFFILTVRMCALRNSNYIFWWPIKSIFEKILSWFFFFRKVHEFNRLIRKRKKYISTPSKQDRCFIFGGIITDPVEQ